MKIAIRELMEKIDGVQFVIDNLRDKDDEICDKAVDFLYEYIDMLSYIKVDI